MGTGFVDWIFFCLYLTLSSTLFYGRPDLPQAERFEAPPERDLPEHDFNLRHHSCRLVRRKSALSVTDGSGQRSHA